LLDLCHIGKYGSQGVFDVLQKDMSPSSSYMGLISLKERSEDAVIALF
jgi:hypothetical protein